MISDGIRTSTKSKRLDVKLPTDDIFIHTCFIDCAHDLYEDPYVMKSSESDRIRELDKRLQECISNSIDKLIPTMDIINNHIPAMGDDVSFTGKDDEDIEDISPTSTTEKAEDLKEVCEEDDGEPKTIPTTAAAAPTTTNGTPMEENKEDDREEEPDLFPDAPDKISSKE